ncbi:5-oxoprolinase subunit C family protein [Mucilaginibacter myungsuensis]|uniref:Biotin-dependent carboxyltransferase family protein n=1 Tax=Mucilaginibacter myungsuensis TaxID=649104 RepID=A0A929KSN7_9SPHI|nr:biotin-dependent carboxyltransferase family protein [Mucilaginibacter myungsuensis]MBE9660804.1 biotin-dependent carboxyltransferase family protein [Mucilaginibacter myungsuensis]MDN3600850.1 biotin-dependent carboxyltransferase family protein [Mucilaginibacter myungsuensis]
MRITFIKPGLLTTVQDLGRHGYLSQAVPVSGVMDTLSARLANIAIGNDENAAVLEFTYSGATFRADDDMLIAYSGEGACLSINNKILPSDRPVFIPQNSVVKSTGNALGIRTYLAVAGGWDVPEVLGSRSTYLPAAFGGLQGRAIHAGDVLNACEPSELNLKIFESLVSSKVHHQPWLVGKGLLSKAQRSVIRIMPAAEFRWFSGSSIADLLTEPFTIGLESDRMGYHMEGRKIQRVRHDELLSTAVAPGTIQVTGNGSMILLMADCQTTGGYPRIAQVAAVDLPLCSQLKPGDAVYFEAISRIEAEMLYIEREYLLKEIAASVRAKFL